MSHVAVLVPGIMGSVLSLGTEIIWPGAAGELIFEYGKLKQLLDPKLVPVDVIRRFAISSQYQHLIDDLNACGFVEAESPPTLVVFPYDWRKDIALAAAAMADTLDRVCDQHLVDHSSLQLSLIAHSMGGLVSRFYLESGRFDGRPAFAFVRRLITLGTPHVGAPKALTTVLGMERALFLSKAQACQLAADPRYPSAYQLLPPRGYPAILDGNASAELTPLDIYDDGLAASLGLERASLDAVIDFRRGLDLTRKPPSVRYFFFSGTRQPTQTATHLLEFSKNYRITALNVDDGGDGTVPIWSSMQPGIQGLVVGGEHGTIYKDRALRTTLARLLGSPGVLAAPTDLAQIAVRDRVLSPADTLYVSMTFSEETTEIDGELRFEYVDPITETSTPLTSTFPVGYRGMAVETVTVMLTAPPIAGMYRVVFMDISSGIAVRAGADEFFVQTTGTG